MRTSIKNLLTLAVVVVAFYFMREPLTEVLSARDGLTEVGVVWFVAMFCFEAASFACIWWLFKLVLPNVSWLTIAVSQLISNAFSRIIPGGVATGSAVQFKVLLSAGVKSSEVVGALLATSVLTLSFLFVALPIFAGALALISAPPGGNILWFFTVAPAMLIVLVAVGYFLIRSDRFWLALGKRIDDLCSWGASKIRRSWNRDSRRLLDERNRLISLIGKDWLSVLVSVSGKWFFGCGTLAMALQAAGVEVRLSWVMLAFLTSSVLSMVPITPGGVGFVEVGLHAMLLGFGLTPDESGLTVILYRLFSFLVPAVLGILVWLFCNWTGFALGDKTFKSKSELKG